MDLQSHTSTAGGGEKHVLLNPVDGNLSPWPAQADLTGAKLLFYDMVEVNGTDVPFEVLLGYHPVLP